MSVVEHCQESLGGIGTWCEELSAKKAAFKGPRGTTRRERRIHGRVNTETRKSARHREIRRTRRKVLFFL